jgi:hypothetical protein
MLQTLTDEQREALHGRWLDLLVDSYPEETMRFLNRQKDPFANPVGAAFTEGTRTVVAHVLDGGDDEALAAGLDQVIRIRAVQEMPPSAAVAFVLDLKRAAREVLEGIPDADWSALDRRVERALLVAFDVYSRCREEFHDIRVDAIRNQSLKMMERLNEWRWRRRERSAEGGREAQSAERDELES